MLGHIVSTQEFGPHTEMMFLIPERVLRYPGTGTAKAGDPQWKPDKFTLITGLDFLLTVMITNHLHNLPWNKAATPSLENFKSSLSVFSMAYIY